MSDDVTNDFLNTGTLVRKFDAEYLSLEALLACIIDGQKNLTSPPSRQTRIREAFKALTDQNVERIDDPSGKHSRAIYRMAELQYEEYVAQLKPEFGGPIDVEGQCLSGESEIKELAERAREELGLPKSDLEILIRKYNGRYGKNPLARTDAYSLLPIDRLNNFDPIAEKEMLIDFQAVANILSKYGIHFEFKTVFWRTFGKVGESVPNT